MNSPRRWQDQLSEDQLIQRAKTALIENQQEMTRFEADMGPNAELPEWGNEETYGDMFKVVLDTEVFLEERGFDTDTFLMELGIDAT